MEYTESFDVIVIGGGRAGLANNTMTSGTLLIKKCFAFGTTALDGFCAEVHALVTRPGTQKLQ